MLIILMVVATALAAVWLLLMSMVNNEDWTNAAINQVLVNLAEVDRLKRVDAVNREKLAEYHGLLAKVMGLFLGGNHEKEIAKREQSSADLQNGDLRTLSILPMPGYVLQRRFPKLGHGTIHKEILLRSIELYGKKYADVKARHLLAQLLSYPILGVAVSFSLGVIGFVTGGLLPGVAVAGIGTLLVLVFVYAMYDDLQDKLNKRRDTISRQFPNVVSKLALLVTSGMVLDRAWRTTAESQELELYQEMRRTSEEMANLVDPTTAYSNFIDRCNTKETTKLASALIQSQTKGNAEIGVLLKNMAHDAWLERRHTAKRDSEAANSKLMIPTMLLFGAILVMIMVPVAMNFMNLT